MSIPSSYSTDIPSYSDLIPTISNTLGTSAFSTPSHQPTVSGYGNGIPSSISSGGTENSISYSTFNRCVGYSQQIQTPPTQCNSPFIDHLSTNLNSHNPTIGLPSHFSDHQHSPRIPPSVILLSGSNSQLASNQQTSALVNSKREWSIYPERAVSISGWNKTYHPHSYCRSRNNTNNPSSGQTSPFPRYDDSSNRGASLDSHSILRVIADEFVPTIADP